jgi:hypothetical protein
MPSESTPSIAALLIGLMPFAAMCFSVSLWDRIEPMLFGIPFNLFWLISWIMLSSLCMCVPAGSRAKHAGPAHSVSSAAVSLAGILSIVAIGTAVGFLAGVRRKMDLEQWTVGGRGFGTVLVFLLMAGEVYTTFAFLGASGWAYSRGGPILYVLAYLTLGYVVSFFILPQIWDVGRKCGMQTQPDFFSMCYGTKYLAGFVCVVGIASFVPYLQLQITGVGIIVSVASFDGIGRTPATCQAFEATCEFTFERKYPPVINHPKETEFARKVLSGLVGADNVKEFEPTMGAEDFSFFLQEKPGCYFLIGNGDGSHRAGGHGGGPCMLHNPSYDFNDELIPLGGSMWVRLAESWLS